jgi:hypothetical protein
MWRLMLSAFQLTTQCVKRRRWGLFYIVIARLKTRRISHWVWKSFHCRFPPLCLHRLSLCCQPCSLTSGSNYQISRKTKLRLVNWLVQSGPCFSYEVGCYQFRRYPNLKRMIWDVTNAVHLVLRISCRRYWNGCHLWTRWMERKRGQK